MAGLLAAVLLIPGSGLATAQEVDAADGTAEEIPLQTPPATDQAIADRLEALLAASGNLDDVTVSVTGGVVSLSGHTASGDARGQAGRLAARIAGVVSVNNGLQVNRGVGDRMAFVLRSLRERFYDLLALAPLLLVALAVFAAFWFVGRAAGRSHRLYDRITDNRFLQELLRQVVRGAIVLLGFVILLEILDATALLGTLLGAAGILGLAIGFAIRDTVENYLASILLSVRQPFNARDYVVIEGYEGLVVRLTTRETVLMTMDGNHVRIPNATVYKSVITNYTRNPKRRFSFEVGVDTSVDLDAARKLGADTLAATVGVLDDPPARCVIKALGDSNVLLNMLGWVDQSSHDFGKVRGEAIRSVKRAFDDADYEMPEPIYRVRLDQGALPGATAAATQPARRAAPIPAKNSDSTPDVARDRHIEQQIAAEKTATGEENLLEPEAIPRTPV